MEIRTDLFSGDSKTVLKKFSDNSVDFIVTSPPYADQRKGTMAVFTRINMLNGFFQ